MENRCPHPLADYDKIRQVVVTTGDELVKSVPQQGEPTIVTVEAESKFAAEYSVSGWLRWDPTTVAPWYIAWRLTNLPKGVNQNANYLGDRDLTLFKHSTYYHVTTYNYANLNGAGDANVVYNVEHGMLHEQWHFIYYGYSKALKKTYMFIRWLGEEFEKPLTNINHFLLN